jgi:hypothetical protein
MRTTSTALGFDIGFFSMPTRSIASATYTTSSSIINWSVFAVTVDENDNKAVAVFYNTDQNMNDGNVNQTNLKAALY